MHHARDTLAALLRGDEVEWSEFNDASRQVELKERAGHHGVARLVGHLLKRQPGSAPPPLLESLSHLNRQAALHERLFQIELMRVLRALAHDEVPVLLMKGVPLAYSHYAYPWLRPRNDVDILVNDNDFERVPRLLLNLGYKGVPLQGRTLCQELCFKISGPGRRLMIDLHRKTSSRPVFGRMFSFPQLLERSVALGAFGEFARALGNVEALALACTHRVNHYNSERLIWLYDIHLIVERLSRHESREFIDFTKKKQVWTICAKSLALTTEAFRTRVPEELKGALLALEASPVSEPSVAYLSLRGWRGRMLDLRSLPNWSDGLAGLRELTFPWKGYIRGQYPNRPNTPLPLLYLDRLARRTVKMITTTKH